MQYRVYLPIKDDVIQSRIIWLSSSKKILLIHCESYEIDAKLNKIMRSHFSKIEMLKGKAMLQK